jgi:hypothetical protein
MCPVLLDQNKPNAQISAQFKGARLLRLFAKGMTL